MRFLTYNIRHAEGVDGRVSNARIGRVIARAEADVVGLNEVWHIRGLWDQPGLIAGHVGMTHTFEPNHVRWVHALGNAVMTRGELRGSENLLLPGGIENRGALVADLVIDGVPVTFASTHLSLGRRTRAAQIAFLAQNLPRDTPLVLAGDLNCLAGELSPLAEFLQVVECPPASFPSVRPRRALDHIAFSRHWRLDAIQSLPSRASDHLPVFADLTLV